MRRLIRRWAWPAAQLLAQAAGAYFATYEFWVTTDQHRTLFHRLFPDHH